MPCNKLHNEYAALFGRLYADTPKAVFAAVAASFITQGGDFQELAIPGLLSEWDTLHANGIVPQAAPKGPRLEGVEE